MGSGEMLSLLGGYFLAWFREWIHILDKRAYS